MKFKKYIKFLEKLNKNQSIYMPENFDWVKDFVLPDMNLDLPSIEKKGTIKIIMDKSNPIYIGLSDGSKLFFSIDEFNRILGKPLVGKTLVWQIQRSPTDFSSLPSKITFCKVV